MSSINDPEVSKLIEIADELSKVYENDQVAWKDSPFSWLKTLPSRRQGMVIENLVSSWLTDHNFSVSQSPNSEADLVINGIRVEVKGSTLWESGIYGFQQIRDQDYEILICLGISPSDAHIWVIPKEIAMTWWEEGTIIKTQHGGQSGKDTAWLQVKPDKMHECLQPFGGTLSDGLESLRARIAESRR